MCDLNDVEMGRWLKFCRKNARAKAKHYLCFPTNIGTKIVAVAKYRDLKHEEDITNYEIVHDSYFNGDLVSA